MEISSANWFSELELEDPSNFINQYRDDQYSFDDLNNFQSNNLSSDQSYSNFMSECEIIRPLKQLKTNNFISNNNNNNNNTNNPNYDANIHQLNASTKSSSSSSSQIISFEKYATSSSAKPKEEPVILSNTYNNNNNNNWSSNGQLGQSMKRSGISAQDHVLAERKRREKLSQRFIALSALLPGLKKMDKASVLGDAVKHIKNLQERVTKLEEKTSTKTVESFVFVKRSQIISSDHDENSSSSEENNDFENGNTSFPEIEAKVSEKDVLIRIHCENRRGCLADVVAEVEKLQLSIINTSVLPFGGSTLHITIVAQMDVDFQVKVKDVVKKLRQALLIKN